MTGPLLAWTFGLFVASPAFLPPAPQDGKDVQVSTPSTARQCDADLKVDPNDRLHLIAGAEDWRSGATNCAYYASFDGGLTWAENFFTDPDGLGHAKSPCVAFGPNGEAYFVAAAYDQVFYHSTLYLGTSTDGGATIGSWVAVTSKWATLQYYDDSPRMVVDTSNGAYRGAIYVAFRHIGGGGGLAPNLARSTDGGLTWDLLGGFTDSNYCEGLGMVVGLNSELFVGYYDFNDSTIKVATSTDSGTTWGTDVKVCDAPFLGLVPHNAFQTNSYPSMAIDRSGGPYAGQLYVCFASDFVSGSGADVYVSTSTDGGATWSALTMVNDDGTWRSQFFPSMDVDANGHVDVGFYDRRDDKKNVAVRYYVARSSDGGATFQRNRPVSDVSTDFTAYPQGAYIGDYTSVACTDRTLHAMWTDGRAGDDDVYTSPVNLGLSTDTATISAASGGTVSFALDAGPLYGSASYWLLGTVSGTSPGFQLHGVDVPINFDAFTLLTITNANTSSLPGFAGTLGTNGGATASLVAPPLPPALIGLPMDFAFLVKSGGAVRWASDPTHLEIVP
jgi:hypothetical protein